MAITKSYVRKVLKKNLPKLGEAFVSCQYKSFTNKSAGYNPNTGTITDPSIIATIPVMFTKISSAGGMSLKQLEGSDILETDKKGVAKVTDFIENSVELSVDDLITNPQTNEVYSVLGFNVDPYESVYVIHLRLIENL